MVDKDDFSGFAPLQPQVRKTSPVNSILGESSGGRGDGYHPTAFQGLWLTNSSIATMNFPLLPQVGGRHCPHISAALSSECSPNPPTYVVEVKPVP